ncbi:MAG: NAD(P)/FAD-dependent oxidoreductase [Candidatus Nezhaarchaeota archaeon]|nr:NAD(P)/FAD-dependent oxidoreductase [Candidatus Nezhaarchaeota archaeon]
MQRLKYDVIIVGCGPAGIFTALELRTHSDLRILMLDKGLDVEQRHCLSNRGLGCIKCNPCNLVSGWGGAGAFSDGKLTLSPEVGGWLDEYVGREELARLINYVDEVYVRFGAPKRAYGTEIDRIEEFKRKAALAGLRLIPVKIRHLGTERCIEVVKAMRRELESRVDVRLGSEVDTVLVEGGRVKGVRVRGGEEVEGRYVVLAPGRSGAEWLRREAERLNLRSTHNPVDVGVRVEVPAYVMEPLSSVLYEPKFIYYSKTFDDRVRTFCFNPYGEVVTEYYNGVVTVNGQSYESKRTDNSNFAILVSTLFTEPFKEPIAYGRYLASLANLLSGGVIVQRLGDLRIGRRSTWERIKRNLVEPTLKTATPGDLSFVLPYRYLTDILEMLKALDEVTPGVYANHTLLYGVEVKFYSSRLELSSSLETKVRNLFAIGDGAGITRGLVQASASGIVVAREILRREGELKGLGTG